MSDFTKLLAIFAILLLTVTAKIYFWEHPLKGFYFLSVSDIMMKAPEFVKKPIPVPYAGSYIEYPVVLGMWAAFMGALSKSGNDFFILNGLFLCLFSTFNILLARNISRRFLNRDVSLFYFLAPSVLLFTFFNWDALALLFLLAAILFLSRRIVYLGLPLASLGLWTKIFPGFCLVPAFLIYSRERRFKTLVLPISVVVIISLLLNLPFYLISAKGWALFFSFSSKRPPNIDSIWSIFYVVTDRVFGEGFYLKRYYDLWVNYLSFGLMAGLSIIYFLSKIIRRVNFNLLLDTIYIICVFLLTSKVYSPQYNLWITPLLLIIGLNYKKVMLYELLNFLVLWSVFQYFWGFFIDGQSALTFPYSKLMYVFVALRHLLLILLTIDVWRLGQTRTIDTYEKTS
jgi:hypothetical protein